MSSRRRRISDDDVMEAMKGLGTGVDSQLRRYEQKKKQPIPPPDRAQIKSILQHMQHCLLHLARQQDSLAAGLECLQQAVWPRVLQLLRNNQEEVNHTRLQQLLLPTLQQHVFQQVLRLHDGLILCISGECRHEADAKRVATAPFRSHLAAAAHRADGYTRLYSGIYSGCSWDEFMNATTGLQQRLWIAINPFLPKSLQKGDKSEWWERLTDTAAGKLDLLLGQIETQQMQVQEQFLSMGRIFSTQLSATLAGSTTTKYQPQKVSSHLTLADKMEKWHVMWGTQVYQVERYGSDFQVRDEHGVLPPFFTSDEWEPVMMNSLPQVAVVKPTNTTNPAGASTSNKKRRRVIADSDEEEEVIVASHSKDESSAKPKRDVDDTASGLKVRVQTISQLPSRSHQNHQTSIKEIKQQLGVDVEGLAAARDGFGRRRSRCHASRHGGRPCPCGPLCR
jgi:hypothetical protein